MTTETKPATDEEIEAWRRFVARVDKEWGVPQKRALSLIARIDAERERAERAETGNTKLRERLVALRRACREVETDSDALAAQLAEARQQITAERERAEQAEEEAETIGTLSRIARETSAAQLTEARKQIAALREALGPFAKLAEKRDADATAYLRMDQTEEAAKMSDADLAELLHPSADIALTDGTMATAGMTFVRWGDFRRARAALAQTEGAEG